jgi:hypothetical protein
MCPDLAARMNCADSKIHRRDSRKNEAIIPGGSYPLSALFSLPRSREGQLLAFVGISGPTTVSRGLIV